MAGIEVTNVIKSFGATRGLNGVWLSIAGLETVGAGTVSIGGREVTGLRPADRDVAMVFQNNAL